MTPQRLTQSHSKAGTWLRIALLQIVVSAFTILVFQAIQGDATRSSNNRTTCVSQVILTRLNASSVQAAGDATLSESSRARARASVVFYKTLLGNLKPVPPELDCLELLGLPKTT